MIEPHKKICMRCPANASLFDLRHNKGIERDVCRLHHSIKYAPLMFFSEVMLQSSFTLMIIFCHGTMTLLTLIICMNNLAMSTRNLKMCGGSKLPYPQTRGNTPIMLRCTYQLIVVLLSMTLNPCALNSPLTCLITCVVLRWFFFSFNLSLVTNVVAHT
jgi:hypothetical protein